MLDATRRPQSPGALLSYLAAPLGFAADDPRLAGHTNAWECTAVARSVRERGYALDAIDWSDDAFAPRREYGVVFDLHRNLERLAERAEIRWMHLTGGHPRFAYAAERARLDALAARRGVRLAPRRSFDEADVARFDRSLAHATVVTMLGDAVTQSTYDGIGVRIERMAVTASPVTPRARDDDFHDRTFLWFAGSGAVHKGLDRVLEVFARHPELTLHCVGPYEAERDFAAAYRRELYELPNIVSHGWMLPSDPRFRAIASQAAAFVLPSASESMSTAAATCLAFGLIPIVTARCGMDLPPGLGYVLDDEAAGLDEAILDLSARPRADVATLIGRTREHARRRHSREAFSARMDQLMAQYLPRARQHGA
ncbi:MAG: glycosyltransferase [Gemmatimonadaceae bacterium]|nr:glycosyltransferase [Gemmatimonadaceae bacterium]NUR18402.1 glycosyltransferase [Gemmatimonadaceae bacterium]NUS96908.1 glycosyltransferase [Gemmatimonadaceae bacterium]